MMALHLTSCTRADTSSYQAMELANRIENGDLEVTDLASCETLEDGWRVGGVASVVERDIIVAALRAFA